MKLIVKDPDGRESKMVGDVQPATIDGKKNCFIVTDPGSAKARWVLLDRRSVVRDAHTGEILYDGSKLKP